MKEVLIMTEMERLQKENEYLKNRLLEQDKKIKEFLTTIRDLRMKLIEYKTYNILGVDIPNDEDTKIWSK